MKVSVSPGYLPDNLSETRVYLGCNIMTWDVIDMNSTFAAC